MKKFLPNRKYEGDGYKNSVCPSLLLLLVVVGHSSLLQEEVDPAVDDGDHHQGEDELEHTREDCVPGHQMIKIVKSSYPPPHRVYINSKFIYV